MAGRLLQELHQTKPFESAAHEMGLNILRTAFVLQRATLEPLKAEGLSSEQYNVLRILRGAGAEGCSCQQIVDRMVSFDPDLTRLLDKLVTKGWVIRERSATDRRVVQNRITPEGLAVIKRLDKPVRDSLEGLAGHLSHKDMTQLIDLLEKVRAGSD